MPGRGAMMSSRHQWEDDDLHVAPALPEQGQDTGSCSAEWGRLHHVGRVALSPGGRRLPGGGGGEQQGKGAQVWGEPGVLGQLQRGDQKWATYAKWSRRAQPASTLVTMSPDVPRCSRGCSDLTALSLPHIPYPPGQRKTSRVTYSRPSWQPALQGKSLDSQRGLHCPGALGGKPRTPWVGGGCSNSRVVGVAPPEVIYTTWLWPTVPSPTS